MPSGYHSGEAVDGDNHPVDDIGGSNLPASPTRNGRVTHDQEGGMSIFQSTRSGNRIKVDTDGIGGAWIHARHTNHLTSVELRELADSLAPYRSQATANDLVYAADTFCHTCGTKTVENKPRNDAPTFMAPRHGVYAGEK
jgi:hypothetical protein